MMPPARKKTFDFSESQMKKKIFGIKIGTILSVVVSLAAAVLFWLLVKYSQSNTDQLLSMFPFDFRGWI